MTAARVARGDNRSESASLFGCLLVLPAVLFLENVAGRDVAQLALVWAIVAFGAFTFFHHGGRIVTATGVWMLSTAMLFGFAGLLSRWTQPEWQPWVYWAQLWGYGTTVTMYVLFLSPTHQRFKELPPWTRSRERGFIADYGIRVGLVVSLLGAIAVRAAGEVAGPLPDATLVSGALLLALSASSSGLTSTAAFDRRALRLVLIALAVLLFVAFGFSGGGRLNIATLGVAVVMGVSPAMHGRWHKIVLLALMLPVIVLFAHERSSSTDLSVSALGDRGGLGSLVAPVETFAELRYRDEWGTPIERAHGSTFATSAVIWVPRWMWPAKPKGFGAELTTHLRPELVKNGHSMAALAHGEWYYNFGVAGLVAMVPITGFAVRFLDRRLYAAMAHDVQRARDLVGLAIWIALASGLADMLWVGSFTYVERAGTRVLVLSGLGLALGFWRRASAPAPADGGVGAATIV